MSQHSYNTLCIFSLVLCYRERIKQMKAELTAAANAAVEHARLDAEIIRGLQEQVNPIHDKVEKLMEAMERVRLLHKEHQQEMEMVKQK